MPLLRTGAKFSCTVVYTNRVRRALRTLAAADPARALKVACVCFAAIVTALWFRSALLESAQLCVQQQACLANVAAYSIAVLHEP